jgi:hypothetical protein
MEQVTGSPVQIVRAEMSEPIPGAPSTASSGSLYDETGRPIRSEAEHALEPFVSFVREEPVAAALAALVIGYVIGKFF